jgi:hypothetical protein
MYPEQPASYNPEDTPEEMHDKLHLSNNLLSDMGIELEHLPENAQVGYHVGYIKNSDGEIEYTKPLPSVRAGRPKIEKFPEATPANITPSRTRTPKRPYETIFVFSDTQIDYRRIGDELQPIHDERAMRVARLLCKDLQPETIVNCGDSVDLAALSRFKPDSDHFSRTLGPSFQRMHDYYAELRSDNPKAKIVEVDSNHNTRLKDFVLKNMPQLYGVKQAGSTDEDYPVMSYAYLANLKHVGVEWISGYGSAEYHHKPDLVFRHGNIAVSNGSTAAKLSAQEPEVNIVQGHAHRSESHVRTLRNGKYLTALVVGALCRTTGEVPSYHSAVNDRNTPVHTQENWSQSVVVIRDYGNSNYEFRHVMINNGKAYFDGKEYSA